MPFSSGTAEFKINVRPLELFRKRSGDRCCTKKSGWATAVAYKRKFRKYIRKLLISMLVSAKAKWHKLYNYVMPVTMVSAITMLHVR